MKLLFALITSMVFLPLAHAVDQSIIINEDCENIDSEDECLRPDCGWDGDRCSQIIIEKCGYIANDAKVCNSLSNCVWLSDPNRPDGFCTELEDLDGCSGSDGFVIESKSKCISKKGCSWTPRGSCARKIIETCGIFGDEKVCNSASNCVWLSDPNSPEGFCTELEDLDGCSGSDGFVIKSKSKCISKEGCSWSLGDSGRGCSVIDETCGFITGWGKNYCNSFPDCVWLSHPSDLKSPVEFCTELEDLDGCSDSDGFVIKSRSKCISKKGCSWSLGDSGWGCSDAPSQLDCDDFENKITCRRQGCISKIWKKKLVCLGRWESSFLQSLKGIDGVEARQAINDEFGEDTYIVRLVDPNDIIRTKHNPRRIRLFLDKNGVVKKRPRFG